MTAFRAIDRRLKVGSTRWPSPPRPRALLGQNPTVTQKPEILNCSWSQVSWPLPRDHMIVGGPHVETVRCTVELDSEIVDRCDAGAVCIGRQAPISGPPTARIRNPEAAVHL
jgi:hypothetical protein